jgi:hypothetical protein
MEKFLNITGTATTAFAGEQLVSCNGIKTIRSATATGTATLIEYVDGTTTTVNTAAQEAFDVVKELNKHVKAALATSWTNPVYDCTLPKAIDATGIVNA